MKPTNLDKSGCDPTSSNCVIWQGNDIECISLCKGDSITTVVAALAEELCALLDTFKIDEYDLSCLNLAECEPKDFKALINLLIEKICAENNIPAEGGAAGCPDCEVSVCSEFYTVNGVGDTVTSMQLKDYVLAIGNKVCTLVEQINTNASAISGLDTRVTTLENAPDPSFKASQLPSVSTTCVLDGETSPLVDVLEAVEIAFCNLQTSTGNPISITTAIQAACLGINTADQLNGTGQMKDITGWHQTPENLSQSFSNLWKVVCDLRGAVGYILNNCCDTGCDAINLIVTANAISPTEVRLDFSGTIPNNYVDDAIGSTIVITDAGGGLQTINNVQIKSTYFDPNNSYSITLTNVNAALNLDVKTTYRFYDPAIGSTCQNVVQSIALGTDTCPTFVLTPSYTSIGYSFAWTGTTPETVIIELYNSLGTVLLQSTGLNITTANPSGSFINLTEDVNYKIRIVIAGVPCDFEDFTTLTYGCLEPVFSSVAPDYTNPSGDQIGSTIEGWQVIYDAAHP